jgi:hypothetical protein
MPYRDMTIPDAVTIQFDLLMMSIVLLETCRLYYTIYIYIYICNCRRKELCIKLVIKPSLYYDARSEKHQTTYSYYMRGSQAVLEYWTPEDGAGSLSRNISM